MAQVEQTLRAILAVFALVQVIHAQQNINPSTCANPGAFNDCFNQAQQISLTCSAKAGSNADALMVCGCDLGFAELGCALKSCWNVVYGCEYQSLALYWDAYCGGQIGDIPFFPAPDNAPGGCSCNLGHILGNYTNVANSYNSCLSKVENVFACGCCVTGGEITSIYSICPNYNLRALGLSTAEDVLSALASDPSACEPYFNRYDCVRDLDYPPIGTLSYMRALPSTTGALNPSATGGTITTPLCGSTCVLTLGASPTTIIPLQATTANSPSGIARTSRGTRSMGRASGSIGMYLFMVCTTIFWT